NDVFVDGQTIWVAGTNTITPARLVSQAWLTGAPITLPAAMKEPIRNIVKDSTGAIWCGTSDGLIRISRMQLSGQSSISPDSMQYFKGNSVNHLFLDPQQNLWVGTTKMMHVSRVGKFPFRAFTGKGNGDAMDHIYSLVPLTDNKIFATGTNGLYITSTNSGITTRVKGTESLGINHHITSIGQGNWLLSTDEGMYIWNEQKGLQHTTTLLRLYPEWKPFVRNYFNNSVLRDSFMYWVSEENEGVLKWDMRKHTIRQFKAGTSHNAGLPENHFHNLAFDREGRLWLMGDEALTVMDTRRDTVVQVIRESKTGPNSSMFFAMYDDGKVIWFGTFGGGLNGFDKRKLSWTFITEKEGLCNNVVYGILPENESCFWVSTNKGISRVNKQTLECINYYKEDGLQDNGFDEKGALQSGGFLYFGGINGFTRVNTADTALRQQSFPVFIYQISYTLNGQNYTINKLSWDKIQFKPGTVNINIRLAALRFPESNKIRLDYSLETEGLSRQPVEESNIITLSSLKPGNAVLHIGVRDEMDTYHEDAFKMRLFMEPFWYQTWLFWGSLVVATCLLLWGLYKHRINLIEHDHRMRREIASDLHDEIGSTLNSVKVFAKLAETAKEKQPLFEQINFSLKQASAGLRDIIWVLDDKKDNLEELFMRLQQFALPVGNVSGIQIEFICADRPAEISLSKSEKKNLYLICKEAVNNSFKYAYCTAIRIEFFREQGKRILAITDNGKGFSEASAVAGNGLQNMRARAEQSGYKIVIGYPADGGTCIRLMQK
ncbi:MAG: two-component regulator propeller domain-containing protein, partial [Ferruginibacter sp.]